MVIDKIGIKIYFAAIFADIRVISQMFLNITEKLNNNFGPSEVLNPDLSAFSIVNLNSLRDT